MYRRSKVCPRPIKEAAVDVKPCSYDLHLSSRPAVTSSVRCTHSTVLGQTCLVFPKEEEIRLKVQLLGKHDSVPRMPFLSSPLQSHVFKTPPHSSKCSGLQLPCSFTMQPISHGRSMASQLKIDEESASRGRGRSHYDVSDLILTSNILG